MNESFEIIKINSSSVIVIGKSYCDVGNYLSELETELSCINFKGNVIFDLLLSNGFTARNRFMYTKYRGTYITQMEILSREIVKSKYEKYLVNFYKKNISIINKGVLKKDEIDNITHSFEII